MFSSPPGPSRSSLSSVSSAKNDRWSESYSNRSPDHGDAGSLSTTCDRKAETSQSMPNPLHEDTRLETDDGSAKSAVEEQPDLEEQTMQSEQSQCEQQQGHLACEERVQGPQQSKRKSPSELDTMSLLTNDTESPNGASPASDCS